MPVLFNNLRLKTKLLLMLLFLSLISIGLLFFLYARAERSLISQVERYTDDLSTAIQISMEQLTKGEEEVNDERLKDYVQKRKKKGIKDISILDNDKEVIASSNPKVIGKVLDIQGDMVKTPGNTQRYLKTSEGHKNYDILLPVVVGKEQMGYVHIAIVLDDFTELLRGNYIKRLIGTIAVFALGIAVSIFLSIKYTQPIYKLERAAKKVAAGDLTSTLEVNRGDEIGELTKSFNEMIKGLRERRELEDRLIRAEHLSKIGQLASGIAHEVRNPLNLVNLSIDHLKAKYTPGDPRDKEEFLKIVSNIKADIHRLNGMISNFLDYGKPLKLNIQPASLTDMVEEVVSLAEGKLAEQRISVERRFREAMPSIPLDGQQIKACILNIFLNAVQAMPKGGRLTVETAMDDSFASLVIKDTGMGIAREHIPEIFEPYFTTKDTGIGLGLAITKRIIEEHNGRIGIISEPNNGTVVTIELPLKEAEA